MYNDFENIIKPDINYNSDGILLSDGQRERTIQTKEQLFDLLTSHHYKFTDPDIISMKNHLGIDIQTCIEEILDKEVYFKTSRSGGHGGQNVNKVETKVQLHFNIQESKYLDPQQKEKIIAHASKKQLHHDNSTLELQCQETRNQGKNKAKVIKDFINFLNEALKEDIPRIETQIPKHKKEKRIQEKKKHGAKKANRNQPIQID